MAVLDAQGDSAAGFAVDEPGQGAAEALHGDTALGIGRDDLVIRPSRMAVSLHHSMSLAMRSRIAGGWIAPLRDQPASKTLKASVGKSRVGVGLNVSMMATALATGRWQARGSPVPPARLGIAFLVQGGFEGLAVDLVVRLSCRGVQRCSAASALECPAFLSLIPVR